VGENYFHQCENGHLTEFDVKNVQQSQEKDSFAIIGKYWGQSSKHVNKEGRPEIGHEHIVTVYDFLTLLNRNTPEADIDQPGEVKGVQAVIKFSQEVRPNNNQWCAENVKHENATDNQIPQEQDLTCVRVQQKETLSAFGHHHNVFLHEDLLHLNKGAVWVAAFVFSQVVNNYEGNCSSPKLPST